MSCCAASSGNFISCRSHHARQSNLGLWLFSPSASSGLGTGCCQFTACLANLRYFANFSFISLRMAPRMEPPSTSPLASSSSDTPPSVFATAAPTSADSWAPSTTTPFLNSSCLSMYSTSDVLASSRITLALAEPTSLTMAAKLQYSGLSSMQKTLCSCFAVNSLSVATNVSSFLA